MYGGVSRRINRGIKGLTVYIKDLTVQTTAQVPAYSTVDLLSDIGEFIGKDIQDYHTF